MTRKIGPNETLGVACLGITHPHTSGRVKAIQRRTDAKMLGAWDTSPLLTPFVDALGLEARSKEDILADENVHVVLVHSKSEKMADLTIEALEAGKAVLCEKPAGRSSADAKRIVEAVERTGGLVQVGYCWRFAPSVDAMQAALKSGRLGKVVQVRAHGGCSHDEAGTPHMTQPGDIGGAVFVIGCHLIDRILLHFGLPRSVNARITKFPNFHGDESREDAAGAVLNYEDKIVTRRLHVVGRPAVDGELGHHRLRHGRHHVVPLAALELQDLRRGQGRPSGRLDRVAGNQLPGNLGDEEDGVFAGHR